MKPTAPFRNEFGVFAMAPCRGLALNRTYSTQLFVAGTMGKKPASQHANPFHNISNDRGGAFG